MRHFHRSATPDPAELGREIHNVSQNRAPGRLHVYRRRQVYHSRGRLEHARLELFVIVCYLFYFMCLLVVVVFATWTSRFGRSASRVPPGKLMLAHRQPLSLHRGPSTGAEPADPWKRNIWRRLVGITTANLSTEFLPTEILHGRSFQGLPSCKNQSLEAWTGPDAGPSKCRSSRQGSRPRLKLWRASGVLDRRVARGELVVEVEENRHHGQAAVLDLCLGAGAAACGDTVRRHRWLAARFNWLACC